MIKVGLTGGIASGKSTVSRTLRAHNIPVVDADIIARQVVEPGTFGHHQIALIFGDDYINNDNTINRIKLGELVFADKAALHTLNEFMAPLINTESKLQLEALHASGHPIVVYDAALIVEMGNADKYRPLIVVYCESEIQLQRLMSRNSLAQADALARIKAQISPEEKVKLADFVINTSTTIEDSIKQTENIIIKLKEMI